jgi:hypothetical protein
MKGFKLSLCLLLMVSLILAGGQNADAQKLIKGNVRVVIGSKSTGGDTYQNTSIVAAELVKKLDVNVKVDAVGATAAFKALERISNGNTIHGVPRSVVPGVLIRGPGI